MNISCDIGSGFNKIIASNGLKFSYPSIVGEKPIEDAFGIENTRPILFNDKEYLTDKDALNYIPQKDRFNSLSPNWVTSDGWMALLYSAIDKVFEGKGYKGKVNLAIGIPQAIYSSYKKVIQEKLNDIHIFTVGNSLYEVEVETIALPQAFSVMASIKNLDPTEGSIGIIDIGTFTTGFSSLYEGEYNHPESGGMEVGMGDFYKKLKNYLKESHGIKIEDTYKLQKIAMHNVIRYKQNEIILTPAIENIKSELVEKIYDYSNSLWIGSDDRQIVLAGGGASFFEDRLKDIYPNIVSVDEPFFAVSKGMFNLLNTQKPH